MKAQCGVSVCKAKMVFLYSLCEALIYKNTVCLFHTKQNGLPPDHSPTLQSLCWFETSCLPLPLPLSSVMFGISSVRHAIMSPHLPDLHQALLTQSKVELHNLLSAPQAVYLLLSLSQGMRSSQTKSNLTNPNLFISHLYLKSVEGLCCLLSQWDVMEVGVLTFSSLKAWLASWGFLNTSSTFFSVVQFPSTFSTCGAEAGSRLHRSASATPGGRECTSSLHSCSLGTCTHTMSISVPA